MPATAGRVRMPANNRVHSSAALQTHGIWQSAIGYDPYAPNKDEPRGSLQNKAPDPGAENAYMSFQGLLELAKITNTNDNEARGSCNKCGRVGHLTFQCKNFISMKKEIKDKGLDPVQANGVVRLDKMKCSNIVGESSDEGSDGSESSYDSEIERAIAKRYIMTASSKVKSKRKKNHELDDEDVDSRERKKKERSDKRMRRKRKECDLESESEGRQRKRRKKSRKRDKSLDDGERQPRRRSHHHSDEFDAPRRHRRKSWSYKHNKKYE